MAKKSPNKREKLIKEKVYSLRVFYVLIPLLIVVFFSIQGITYPYVGYNAWNFNAYSLIARNYNQFGYLETKLAPILTVSKTLPKTPEYYLHHPQLLSIILSVFYRVFGEAFWVGRMVVILFSMGSVVLMIALSYKLFGRVFAQATAVAASLIPAIPVFGRMINMEPLVLFFAMASFYSVYQYVQTRMKRYFIILISSVILGTLSDWPMVYIAFLVCCICVFKKEKGVGIMIVAAALVTQALFFIYVYIFMNGFQELVSAIINRGAGTLVTQAYWPVLWVTTIILRLAIYFNPIFFLVSIALLVVSVRRFYRERTQDMYLLLILFFLMGIFNVLPFPDGSFGHAYWIYYFIPFFVLSTAWFLTNFYKKKKVVLLVVIIVISFVYSAKVIDWKTKEIATNIWRYELGQKIAAEIPAYSTIAINPDSVVDPDLLAYAFKQNVRVQPAGSATGEVTYVVYSCMHACKNDELLTLQKRYEYKVIYTNHAEAFVFDTHTAKIASISSIQKNAEKQGLTTLPDNTSILRKIYQYIFSLLHLPQL